MLKKRAVNSRRRTTKRSIDGASRKRRTSVRVGVKNTAKKRVVGNKGMNKKSIQARIGRKKRASKKRIVGRIAKKFKPGRLNLILISALVVMSAVMGILFLGNKGRVLGSSSEIKKIVPEVYTQPLVVGLGTKTLSMEPMSGSKVKVEQKGIEYIYRNAYKNTDVIQTEYSHKIKEMMNFHGPGHPVVFKYKLGNYESYKIEKDEEGNILFYDYERLADGQEKKLGRIFTIFAPFIQDQKSRSFAAVTAEVEKDLLIIKIDEQWLKRAEYPVILDPTVEINVLNVHSHPQRGDEWQVSFSTKGRADLRIVPGDEATIEDDEFVWLKCDGELVEPEILDGDVIYYKDWKCDGMGQVSHYTLRAGKHSLRFEFGDAQAWAYNDAGDPWWDTAWFNRKQITIDGDKVGIISDMNADAASGQKNITVKSGSLFAADEYVVIKDDNNEETGQVDSVASNTITLKANLTYNYATSSNAFVKNTTDSADLTDFPVLVNLSSDSDLAADALDSGDDIAFTDNAGSPAQLSHEIESFNGTTGELQAWVKIPTLSASTSTVIYLYYGNAGASNQEDVNGTWDDNYSLVWHMNDLTSSTVKDSASSYANNGNKKGAGEPAEATGQIYQGQDHAGDNDYILSSKALASIPSNWTAEVWFKADSTSGVVVSWLGQSSINTGYHDTGIELVNGTVYVRFWNLSCTSIGTVTTGTWNHAVVRYSGTSLTGFLNGAQGNATSGSLTKPSSLYISTGATDSTNCGSGAYFNGMIDEFRWSDSARGVDWIKTSEKNQRYPSTFYILGSEELISDTVVSSYGSQAPSLNIPGSDQYVGGSFVIQSVAGSRNVTAITITENGTVDAQNNLSNVKLYYENDISDPYNCVSESYNGDENQFGSTGSFNGADGTAVFSGATVGIDTNSTMCVYVLMDVGSGAGSNETLEIKIDNPNTDVTTSSGTVNTNSVEISGSTSLLSPANPTQIHYRWRNDDSGEMGNDPLWGDNNYTYRKKITITGQTGAGTNYQVKLTVGESSGSSGDDFHLEGRAKNDFSDLRLTDNDGSTLLDYWIQEISGTTPNQTATVWVEVRDDLGSNTDIFAYYGYSSAAAYTNGDNTFLFFDDFNDGSVNTSKWKQAGSMTESGGYASGVTSGSDYLFGETRINIDTATVIRMQNKATVGIARPGVLQSNGNPYLIPGFGWQDYSDNYRYTDTYEGSITQQKQTRFTTNWYLLESTWQASSCKFYVDGDLYATHTTNIPASSRVLYAQVEGNAYYDYIFTRKYITTEPDFSAADTEESPTAGATFSLVEDAAMTGLTTETVSRLRLEISNEGGQTSSDVQYRLEVSEPNPVSCAAGNYERLSTDADWEMIVSSNITEGEVTFDISPGLTNENTTFVSGELRDTADETGAISLSGSEFVELEYSLQATASASAGATYCFRLTNAGDNSGFTYTQYAQVTIFGVSSTAPDKAHLKSGTIKIQGGVMKINYLDEEEQKLKVSLSPRKKEEDLV